jgi:hypothetical protein
MRGTSGARVAKAEFTADEMAPNMVNVDNDVDVYCDDSSKADDGDHGTDAATKGSCACLTRLIGLTAIF